MAAPSEAPTEAPSTALPEEAAPGRGWAADPHWVRSSYSTGMNNCVEAARLGGSRLAVRDAKDPEGPALLFGGGTWESFMALVRTGTLDGPR